MIFPFSVPLNSYGYMNFRLKSHTKHCRSPRLNIQPQLLNHYYTKAPILDLDASFIIHSTSICLAYDSWNALPEHVVMALSLNCFKSWLNVFWKNRISLVPGATVPDQNQETTTRMHLQRLSSLILVSRICELCE